MNIKMAVLCNLYFIILYSYFSFLIKLYKRKKNYIYIYIYIYELYELYKCVLKKQIIINNLYK